MTLSPQERMEKANPYKDPASADWSSTWRQGYTASHKDNAEMIAKLEAERDEVLEAVDLMIVDRDEIYKERDRLREAIEQARLINSDFLTDSGESIGDRIERILSATLTPQPADTPCEECGTVGGGGKVPGMRSFSAACSDQVWKPCPRCGQLSETAKPDR